MKTFIFFSTRYDLVADLKFSLAKKHTKMIAALRRCSDAHIAWMDGEAATEAA